MAEAFLLVLSLLVLLPYLLKEQKDAPFVPLEPQVIEEVMKLADIQRRDIFYDLGSGDGRLVIAAALKGVKEAYGVELNLLRVVYSRVWLTLLGLKNARIIRKDLFEIDFSKATIITLYLLQSTNNRLAEKLMKGLKPGTRIVSIAFSLPGYTPVKVSLKGPIFGPLYLYEVGLS